MYRLKKKLKTLLKTNKPSYKMHDPFWVQELSFIKVKDRFPFFGDISKNKRVLHFGCTDWPIFNPSYNLHIYLAKVANVLHGFDIDKEGINNLKKYVDQPYFSKIEDIDGMQYDICLIPETIEHVENIGVFLKDISKVNSKEFYITAPNCFSKKHMERNYYDEKNIKEVVHPDHNCWFSPFTLKNVIEKYSNLNVVEIYLLNDDTMVCCKCVDKEKQSKDT